VDHRTGQNDILLTQPVTNGVTSLPRQYARLAWQRSTASTRRRSADAEAAAPPPHLHVRSAARSQYPHRTAVATQNALAAGGVSDDQWRPVIQPSATLLCDRFPAATVDTGKVRVYSWSEIVAWLREALGEDVPKVPHELVLADHALRLADEAQRGGKADMDAVRHLVGSC
jgi:hypothetical protein